jgi:hypothetical protein
VIRRYLMLAALTSPMLIAAVYAEAQPARFPAGNPFSCGKQHRVWTTADSLCVIRRVFARDGRFAQQEAVKVATCESGLSPFERTGESTGLFQIYDSAHPDAGGLRVLLHPVWNALYARQLWQSQGRRWRPAWACAYIEGVQ